MKNICLQMSRKAWLALFTVLCLSFPALAQKITVSGTVVDPSGEPLIGATVLAQGTTHGTATDIDGNYRLDVDANGTLVFSYVGYDNQTVAVNGRTHIDVTLNENSVMLNEVVAIGYGTVKKSDATGSIAVIKPDDIETGIATSTQDLLVGASPGVTVTLDGGNPNGTGTIRIRGGSSLRGESNDPLIVIDGVPQTNQTANGANALTMVNPQDIEQLTVLKDASATAIYGSRASNGVIIITTKKGQSGKPKVSFAANWHVRTARKVLDMMSGHELTEIVRQEMGEQGVQDYMGTADTDWQKEVLRTSFSMDYNLSVSGTAGWLPYRVSASYTDSQGIMKRSDMKRTTVGFSLAPKFFHGLLQINANANGTYMTNLEANTGAIGGAIGFNPSLPVYADYDNIGLQSFRPWNGYANLFDSKGQLDLNQPVNPVQLLNERTRSGKNLASTGNIQIDYALHFLPELHLNLNLGYQVSENTRRETIEQNSAMAWNNQEQATDNMAGAGTLNKWYELQRNTLLDFYLNYRKEFDAIKSNLDVMAGYSWQRFSYFGNEQTYYQTKGFQTMGQEGKYPLYANGAFDLQESTGDLIGEPVNGKVRKRWANHLQLISFFGRLNYSLQDTYLLTFTLRDDASSRFAKDERWGLFPSLALGWKVSNMPVFDDIRTWFNDLKLRMGWGMTGQQDIGGYFPYLPTYTSSYETGFWYPGPDGQWLNPLYPNPYVSNITWEKTATWNVGLDFAWLNNRITASVDWYLRQTTDMLINGVTAGVNTSNKLDFNAGSMRNVGVEINIGARPVVTRDFTWYTGLNAAYNNNKLTSLNEGSKMMSAANTPDGIGTALQYHIVGEAVRSFYVYEQVYDADGNPVPDTYVDQNGDGQITDLDKIVYHNPDPKWTFNWNNTFNWKNWDLGITLRANVGNYVYNGPRYSATNLSGLFANSVQINNMMADEFLFPNQVYSTSLNLSSYWIENASFIRCDNISLGYTFDHLFNNKLNLRIFGVVQNPFVITKYKGIDPEVFGGIDNNVYPRPITGTLGIVATF